MTDRLEYLFAFNSNQEHAIKFHLRFCLDGLVSAHAILSFKPSNVKIEREIHYIEVITLKRLLLSVTLSSIIVAPASAATPEEALASRFRAMEAYVDVNLAKESVPGSAVGIVHDQDIIWSHQYGVESFETNTPVSNDTLFSICSVSKLFNGVAAMSLVDQGKMSLDAPLSTYDNTMDMPDSLGSEEPVTMRGILSHVSGLPREGNRDYWADTSFPDSDALVELVQSQEALYNPYNYQQYSNIGMSMLGAAISSVSGKSWGDYVDQTIFSPLGMDKSSTDMPFDLVGNGFAQGYFVRDAKGERKPVQAHSFSAFAPAAGIASSVNDLAKFAAWHFRLADNGGSEILKATTLKNMLRVHWVGAEFDETAWGLAYVTRRYDQGTLWGHGGYCPGARTEFVMRLPKKIAVAMMVSVNDVSPGAMVKSLYGFSEAAITKVYGSDKSEKKSRKKNSFAEYEGHYYWPNYPTEVYIGLNEDGLFGVDLLSRELASSVQNLEHLEGDTFVRKRKDGSSAETVTFERDADGKVVSLVQHGYRTLKR